MTIQEIIENCIKQNQDVRSFIQTISINRESPDQIIPKLKAKLQESNYNTALQSQFALYIQLINNIELINEFELKDLISLYSSAIEIQEFNLDYFVELAHFNWAVLDDEIAAREIAQKGIDNANKIKKELELLIEEMNNR